MCAATSSEVPKTLPQAADAAVGRDEYEVEVVTTHERLVALVMEWKQFLLGDVRGNNFYNDPEHVALRWKTCHDCSPWIVVLRRGGSIRAIAPFYTDSTRFRLRLSVLSLGSLPILMVKLFGDRLIIANDEDSETCFQTVFATLQAQHPGFGLAYFENLNATSPLWNFLRNTFWRGGMYRLYLALPQMEKVHRIRLPSTHEAYLTELNARTRQSLRRKVRKLCDQEHVRLELISTAEQVPAFLDQLDQIYQETWQAKTFGHVVRNTPAQREYFEELARQGWLRSYLLTGDHGPLAYELGFQYDNVFWCFEHGFRQRWADLGPGSVLTYLLIEDLFRQNSPKVFDFGFGDLPHKRSFSNSEYDAAAIYLVPRNGWRLVLSVQRALNGIERFVRGGLIALKIDRPIRKLLKRRQ